jgi:hypothetical protein
MRWYAVKTEGDIVPSRDEHTAILDGHGQMIVFGGFVSGYRTNNVSIYNINNNSWTSLTDRSGHSMPCPRSGHSAVYF